MEKIDKSQMKDYGPLVMWTNDLEELFSELSNRSKFEFIADDVKFDSVEELNKVSKGRNPSKVKFSASDPDLTVELYPHWARLYVSSSELLASGLFLKIDLILSRCEKKPKFFYQYVWAFGGVFVLQNLFMLPPLKPYTNLYLCVVALSLLWLFYVIFIKGWRFSIIRPMHREERPSFFRRNFDAIVVAIISGVFGALVGVVATKMADKVWASPVNERAAPKTIR
jgi:hypothetical protein